MAWHTPVSLLLCLSIVQTALSYTYIKPPQHDTPSQRSHQFYFTSANYSVGPGLENGFLDILKLELTPDSWVIVFLLPGPARRRVYRPCQTRNLQNNLILKVYDQNNVIREGDTPDGFHVGSSSVLCILAMRKDKSRQWGSLKYRYDDEDRRASSWLSTSLSYRLQMNVATLTKCMTIKPNHSLAITFLDNLTNKTSADRVVVKRRDFKTTRTCNRYSDGCYDQARKGSFKELFTMTAQTRPGHFLWPMIVRGDEGAEVCFYFQAINSREFKGDVVIQVGDYPECNGNVTDRTGILLSPGYPEVLYRKNLDCTWNMQAKPGQRFLMKFEDAESDCVNDYVKLEGVEGSLNNAQILCGTSMTGSSFLSASNWLTINFRTNKYKNLKGFLVNYTAIGCSIQDAPLPDHSRMLNVDEDGDYIPPGFRMRVACERGYIFPSRANEATVECLANNTWSGQVPFCIKHSICNGSTLVAKDGTISSPGYPKPSPKDITCVWNIEVDEGQTIEVLVEDIKSSCVNDYILLHDAANTTKPMPVVPQTGEVEGNETASNETQEVEVNEVEPEIDAVDQAYSMTSLNFRNQIVCGENALQGNLYRSRNNTLTITFRTNVYDGNGFFKLTYMASGCSLKGSNPINRYRVKNPSSHYPVGYQLEIACTTGGEMFSTGEKIVTLACQSNGEWDGQIPLCVQPY